MLISCQKYLLNIIFQNNMLIIRCNIQKLFSAYTNFCQPLGSNLNSTQIRTKVRYHLPYPTETKRVRKQGFHKKTQTPTGRRQLMLRILKGDKVIAQ